MRHHAVVGTDTSFFDVPRPPEDLRGLGHAEGALIKDLAQLRRLIDGGQVGQQDATGTQRLCRVLNDFPWFGHVENNAIEAAFFDSLGDVTDLDRVVDVVTKHGDDILAGMGGEILPDLVAQQGHARTQKRHRERPGSHTSFEDTHARTYVGGDEDGPKVLGVDHLSTAWHLDDDVGQCGSQDQEVTSSRSDDDIAFVGSDDVVVGHDPCMGVERCTLDHGDEVTAFLGVDEHDALARKDRPEWLHRA